MRSYTVAIDRSILVVSGWWKCAAVGFLDESGYRVVEGLVVDADDAESCDEAVRRHDVWYACRQKKSDIDSWVSKSKKKEALKLTLDEMEIIKKFIYKFTINRKGAFTNDTLSI